MILNVGCGGRTNDKFSYYGDCRIDTEKFDNVTHVMDAHHLKFQDKMFDKIVAFEVLEHLDSPIQAMKEFKRVLKDDGKLLISVPNIWYWRKIIRFSLRGDKIFGEDSGTDHKQAWDIYEMRQLAKQVGLKIKNVYFVDWYSKGLLKMSLFDKIVKSFLKQCAYTHIIFELGGK